MKIDVETVEQVLRELAKVMMIERLGERGVRISKVNHRWLVTCGKRRVADSSLTAALARMCEIQGIEIATVYEMLYGEKLPSVL